MAEVKGIALKRRRFEVGEIDINKCIICQMDTNESTCSNAQARLKIIEAARIRNDLVARRLEEVDHELFVYHVNNECYKSYTLKKTLTKFEEETCKATEELEGDESVTTPSVSRTTRATITPRAPPSRDIAPTEKICTVCGNVKQKGDRQKFRICEDVRADKFLKAAVFFQDEVYCRTSDLEDVHSVFGSDLYCHKNCIRNYLIRYDRAKSTCDAPSNSTAKNRCFSKLLENIDSPLQSGQGFALSDLRDSVNAFSDFTETFSNRDIRLFLESHYGQDLNISRPTEANKCDMVFLNAASPADMAGVIRSSSPITECASAIRQVIVDYNFDLQDKFCDSVDLKESWDNMQIPDELVTFLCVLFNYDRNDLVCTVGDDDDDTWAYESSGNGRESLQLRKLKSVFQVLYFMVHNGRRRTPMHLMCGEGIHAACKSKTLITSLNHLGLSVSYDEVLRHQNDLADLVCTNGTNDVPLPSHLNADKFTTAAFDNFDHEEATVSGLGGTHDTVSVLYQDKSDGVRRKPQISETGVVHGPKSFQKTLTCQELKHFFKPATKGGIASDFSVSNSTLSDECIRNAEEKDVAWSVARMNLLSIEEGLIQQNCDDQQMPGWSAFNSVVTAEKLSERIVGFLPILPHPVTEYSTVYTALKNFQNILRQLRQDRLAITCDEGVYRIAREIMMLRPEEFSDLTICLGSFHLLKIYLGCVGKYLRGSGADSIWIENEIFGRNTTQAVLGGTHYVRSLEGLTLLSESMERLQWSVFFCKHGVQKYMEPLKLLREMKQEVSAKNNTRSKELFNSFLGLSGELFQDFKEFKREGKAQSKTFAYWDQFIEMVRLAKDIVRADREGDWHLHLHSVEAVLPYFAVFDSINYLRWCSLYLEDMKKLPETAPLIHDNFMAGRFVVKRSSTPFSAVAADMCLEQTINRSSKTSGGIIGNTKRKEYVTRWNIIHHELMAVNETFRDVTGVQLNNTELTVNHSFSNRQTQGNERKVEKMMAYILKYENPFEVKQTTELKLHNLFTRAIVPNDIEDSLLSVQVNGVILYQTFRKERLVEKTKRLSDTICRNNVKTFASAEGKTPSAPKTKQRVKQELGVAQKQLDIARVRGYDAEELFTYDLVQSSSLFDEDGLMTKPTKHELMKELESTISADDYIAPTHWKDMLTGYIVDVMANVRKLKTSSMTTFGEFCYQFLSMVLGVCKNASRIDFIFDSYIKGSVKDSERLRRTQKSPILYSDIALGSKLARDMDSFWPSPANKVKLEQLIKGYILDHFTAHPDDLLIVLSRIVGDETSTPTQSIKNGELFQHPDLDTDHEEADIRIIPHAVNAVRQSCTARIVILSSDTDVFVAAMYFYHLLAAHGLAELWLRGGVGDKTRFIPLHVIAAKVGKALCEVLPATHALTGCDITSKFGTKAAGIKAQPVRYLKDFGRAHTDVQDCVNNAEKFLVQVLNRGNHGIETMDRLRFTWYHHRKSMTITDLPPTSYGTEGHIQRAFYATYIQVNCLGDFSLNPQDYGFTMESECLVPTTYHRNLPDEFSLKCNCVKCAIRSCPCREKNLRCCMFCKCQEDSQCKNCKNPNGVILTN